MDKYTPSATRVTVRSLVDFAAVYFDTVVGEDSDIGFAACSVDGDLRFLDERDVEDRAAMGTFVSAVVKSHGFASRSVWREARTGARRGPGDAK